MTLYPDVRCKILYQRDYLNLLVKYGLEQPSQHAPSSAATAAKDEDLLGPALAG
jgi:hypothetical protein